MIARLKAGFTVTRLVSAAAALSLAASPWLAGFTGDAIADRFGARVANR